MHREHDLLLSRIVITGVCLLFLAKGGESRSIISSQTGTIEESGGKINGTWVIRYGGASFLQINIKYVNVPPSAKCTAAYVKLFDGSVYCGDGSSTLETCYVYRLTTSNVSSCVNSCSHVDKTIPLPPTMEVYSRREEFNLSMSYKLLTCTGVESTITDRKGDTTLLTTTKATKVETTTASTTIISPSKSTASTQIQLTTSPTTMTNVATVIVVAVVCSFVLVAVLLLCLYRRRNKTEGNSTQVSHISLPSASAGNGNRQQLGPEPESESGYLDVEDLNVPGEIKTSTDSDPKYVTMEHPEAPDYENLGAKRNLRPGEAVGMMQGRGQEPYYDNVGFDAEQMKHERPKYYNCVQTRPPEKVEKKQSYDDVIVGKRYDDVGVGQEGNNHSETGKHKEPVHTDLRHTFHPDYDSWY